MLFPYFDERVVATQARHSTVLPLSLVYRSVIIKMKIAAHGDRKRQFALLLYLCKVYKHRPDVKKAAEKSFCASYATLRRDISFDVRHKRW